MLDAKTDLSLTLHAEEWNIVLDALSDGRHRIVAPVIQKIIEQAQSQAQQQQDNPVHQLKPVS